MIRRSGISSCWQYFMCCAMVLAFAGCDRTSPSAVPNHASTPPVAEPSHEAPGEPFPAVAEPELALPAEVVGADVPATGEQAPAETGQKPIVPASNASKKPKVALSVPDLPDYVYEPHVLMSQRDADSCLVKKGEPFPVVPLSDLAGQEHSLKELFGEKLTVIVFWGNSNRLGREQIQRLEAETVLPFENTGLSVVAINISDSAEQISDLLTPDRQPGFTILLDPDAALFSKVATGRHPRTYLLDATGNVLWYDIEYSRGMARDLANAIHVYLGGSKTSES